jgi:hypothetical protein
MVPRPEIVAELREFGIAALVTDPLADPAGAKGEYGVELGSLEHFTRLDGLILAVPRRILAEGGKTVRRACARRVVVDVKSVVARDRVPQGTHYWSLLPHDAGWFRAVADPGVSLIDGKILARIGFCGLFRPDQPRQLIVFSIELTANSLSDRTEN